MRTIAIMSCIVFLSGCAAVQSKEAFIGCRAADVVTTTHIINAGGVEENPILKPIIKNGLAPFWLTESAITLLIVSQWDNWTPDTKGAVNVIGCAAPVHNLAQMIK